MRYFKALQAIAGVRLAVKPGQVVSEKKLGLGEGSLARYLDAGYIVEVQVDRSMNVVKELPNKRAAKAVDPAATTAEKSTAKA